MINVNYKIDTMRLTSSDIIAIINMQYREMWCDETPADIMWDYFLKKDCALPAMRESDEFTDDDVARVGKHYSKIIEALC